MTEWRKCRDQAFLMGLTQQREALRVMEALENHEIAFLPLKGYWMKQMYPQPYYRQMADLDILIDADKAGQARKVMKALGYRTEDYGAGAHDSYFLEPYVSVELHRTLMTQRNYAEYFSQA